MKRIVFNLIVCILVGCSHSKVKTTYISVYEVIEESGTVMEGDLTHYLISTYDPRGNKTESQKFDAECGLTELYRYTYDRDDHLIERRSFDPAGNQVQEDIYDYNEEGKLIENDRYNDLLNQYTTFHHAYDATGRKTEVVRKNADGEVQAVRTFLYDSLGNKRETFEDMEHGFRSVIRSVYDGKGKEIEYFEYEPDGSVKLRHITEYDEHLSILKRVTFNSEGEIVQTKSFQYQYDKKGNWIRITEYRNSVPQTVRIREIEYF